MEKTAREVITAGNVPSTVDFAIELHRRIAAQGRELDEVKRYLREVAKESVGNSGARTSEILGNLGTASVVFERDQVKPRKGLDLSDIEENLSAETFAKLFVTRVVVDPALDLLDKLGDLSPPERAVVENFLDIVPSTPKVYLPK
jgi:hypothetical protein